MAKSQYKFPDKFTENDIQAAKVRALNSLFASLHRLEAGSGEKEEIALERQITNTASTIVDALNKMHEDSTDGVQVNITIGEIE